MIYVLIMILFCLAVAIGYRLGVVDTLRHLGVGCHAAPIIVPPESFNAMRKWADELQIEKAARDIADANATFARATRMEALRLSVAFNELAKAFRKNAIWPFGRDQR